MAEATVRVNVLVEYDFEILLDASEYDTEQAMLDAAEDMASTSWDDLDYSGIYEVTVDEGDIYDAWSEEE